MTEEDISARAQDAENVAFEDVLAMSLEELQRIAPALEARARAASKIADEAVADAADAIAIASAGKVGYTRCKRSEMSLNPLRLSETL